MTVGSPGIKRVAKEIPDRCSVADESQRGATKLVQREGIARHARERRLEIVVGAKAATTG